CPTASFIRPWTLGRNPRGRPCGRVSGAACRLCQREFPNRLTGRDPLIPLRSVLRQLGDAARLVQTLSRLRPALPRPRLPAPRPVAPRVVRHRLEHRVTQPCTLPWPRRLQLRRERGQGLLGSLEADLARLHAIRAGGYRHDRAEQVVRQEVNPDLLL